MMQQEEEQIIPPPKRNSGYTPMSDNGIIPPPRKIAEDIEILSEKQSRQKGLYPEEGYEGMVAFKPKPKQQHEDIREYIPRLKEVFHKVKDKNKFLEQLYAGHEFKKGTPEELKSALDETIDFTAPREFNSYESKRAKEKVFQSLSEKIDKLNYKGDEYSKDAVKVMIEGMINKNEFNLTEKEKRDVRSSLLDHIKQKPIENQAKRNADRAFTDKYGQSPDEVFDIEKTVIRERDNVIQEAKEWGKSEQTKNNSIAYSEIGRIRVQAEAQTAQYKNQLQEKIANGLINEDEASRELHNFNLQKQTEYNDALKQIQTRYIQRFNEINKGIQQKAESNFEERLKGVDESVREKAKEYSKIYGKEYEDFARKMGEVDEAVFRKLPMQTIIGSKIHSGVFNTLSTIGGALTRAGADNAGDNITQVANDQLRELNLPQLTRESVLDPKFWAATISESMPFTVATMIPAIATGGTSALLTGLGARAIGAGAVTAATAGQLTGAVVGGLTGWYLESKLEAGGAYLDALKRGETESEALEKAKYVDDWNNANIALSIAEMMPVFRVGKLTKFKPLKAITKITETVPFGMAAEGAQEFYQGYGQGKAVDRELTLGEYASTEDAFVSTVSGALMGVGFGIAGKFMEKSPNAAPKIIAKMVQEGSPVSAAIEAATLNEAISDEMKQALDQITQSAETANERFNDIADPVLKSAAVSLSAEIKQLEGRLRGDAVDESVNAQIKEKQKQLSEIQNGTAQVIGVYIDSEIPMITTEKEVMEMAKDPEFADAFFNGKVKVDFRNVDNKQFLETIQQTYDTQNQKGVQGGERTGQEPVEGQPDQSTGTKTSETNRIFSEQEKEIEAKFSNVVSEIAASVSGKIDAVEQKAGRGEIIDSKEIESAINGLYDMLDKIDNSDLRPSEKQQASVIIESKINKLENYERTSVSKSYGITQESAGKTSRQVKPILKEIEGKPITFNREEAVIEERNGEYIIASKSGETNIGEVQINNRDIRLDETKGDYGITFDNTGNVESVNLIDRNGNEIQLKGDAALDVAIKLRMQEVGFIPDNVFEREYDAIMAEERLANQREKSKTDKSAATKERSASLVEEQKPVTEDKTAEQPEETPNVEDWSKDVESTAKALEGINDEQISNIIDDENIFLPVKLFHWGAKGIKKFNPTSEMTMVTGKKEKANGIYFTADENLAKSYKKFKPEGELHEAFVIMKNPKYVDTNLDAAYISDKKLKDLKNQGYDGVIYKGKTGHDEVVVFKPENIVRNTDDLSEAYHKAKSDGSNPELVKAVEDLLGKPTEQPEAAKEPAKNEPISKQSKPSRPDAVSEGTDKGTRESAEENRGGDEDVGEKKSSKYVEKPIKEINTDESRFQNRTELDEKHIEQIVNNWDDNELDPVVIWKDKEGKVWLLAGHHRLEAAKRLGKTHIDARYFNGTESKAIQYAKDKSNANRTMEADFERASRLRQMRGKGASKKEIDNYLEREGRNKNYIENISYLNPKGKAFELLQTFGKASEKDTRRIIEAVSDKIGVVRKMFPQLTDEHENEMFEYLYNGKGRGIASRAEFVQILTTRLNWDFNPNEPLNFEHRVGKGNNEIMIDNEIKSLKSRRAELTDEIKKTQKTITDKPQRDKIVSDLTKQVIDINQKIGDLEKKISSAQEADRKQYDIFSQINESVSKNEITHEQVRNFEERTAEQAKQSESIIKDIESTAKNTQRASTKELQAAEKQSEELINEITEAPPIGYSKPIEESEGAKPDGLKKFVSDEKSKAIAEGFESLTHKINTIRKVNNITDERKNIQDFTEEEINKAIASKKAASKPIQERLKPIQERSKPIQEQLEDAKKELKEAWNNLKNPGFMYNPKAEAEKHLDFDKKLLKFAILAIKKYGGDLAKATTFTFNQLKNLAGIIGLKDEGQLSELMNDAISEYSSLPSDKKDLATTKEKNELKAFISGIATGLKQAKKTHKQAQEEIREYIKTNLDGKFSNAAIRQMLSSVGKIVNEETYNQQLPVIQKLIDSARYARLVEDVANLKSKSKRHEKPILMQRMRAINPLALDEADLIQYKAALEAANQKVPSYRLAENIIANLETKNEAYQAQFANKEKTIDDLNKSLDELDKDIDSVDAYRNFLNHLRSFTRTANILLKEGKITQAEYDGFMSSVYDADGVLLTKLHDKINKFRSELADEILSTDISGYAPTEAEAPFFKELNSLRKDLLMKVSPITLSEILEVKQRIATEGFAPMEQMIDGVTRALSDINSKKLTKQFESTTLKERSVEYIRMLLGMKEKAFWTRLLGVTGTALYDTFINPMARAVEQQKRIMDEMYSEMFKKLDTAGFLSGNTRDKLKMKYKVAMFFHYMGERGLRGSTDPKTKVGKDRIGFRDIFGGLMGNEKEREDYTDAQKKRADEQWDLYSVYDREIIKEIYDELLSKYKTPDGRMDLDKMESDFYSTLNEKEKALYDIHKSITDKLSDYQRVANASTKTEFIPVEGYIMRQNKDTSYKGKDVFDFVLGGLSKPSVESGSGKERATNDPMAVNLDLKELLIRGIQMTATHYALGFANNLTAETINKSNVRADIKQALRDAKNNMLQFEYKYSISNKILNNIVNSAAYISLVSLPRTVAEAFVTPISTFLTLIDSAGGVDSIASNYDRKKTKEIMEQTNSTLLDKLKLKGEKHFEIESARELKRVGKLKQLGHASVSISEAIAMPLWYAMFRTEFTRLTGVDYNTITDNTKYWQEVKEAASYADLEMKQITGGGIKSEGREYVQISPVPIIPAFKLKILNKKYGLTKDVSLSVRRETPLGKMFGFLQEYPFRDSERLFGSIRNMGNAPTRESMRITGTLMNMLGYGMAAAFTRLAWQWLFALGSGDDERKDEIESAMQEMLEPKYYVENAVGAMVQTAGIRMSGAGRAANIILASVLYNFSEDEEQKNMVADFVEREYYSPIVGGSYTKFVKSELNGKTRKILSTTDFLVNLNPVIRFISDMAGQFVDRHGGIVAASEAINEIMWKIENGHEVDPSDAEFLILYNNLINVANTVLIGRGVQLPETRSVKRELKNIIKNSEFIESIEK